MTTPLLVRVRMPDGQLVLHQWRVLPQDENQGYFEPLMTVDFSEITNVTTEPHKVIDRAMARWRDTD